jgi:glycerol uptake facilitator-like aquaporin
MEFLQHTLNWVKGELFEGKIIAIVSFAILLSSFVFWKFGITPNAKAIVIPLLVVGIIAASVGVLMVFSNQKRLVAFQSNYEENPTAFIQSEKERVEDFQYMYKTALIATVVFLVVALCLLWFTKSQYLHALAIALMLFGLSLQMIDYFSKERAKVYYEHIDQEINK